MEVKITKARTTTQFTRDADNPLNLWQKKVKNKNLNIFVRNNAKKKRSCTYALASTLWGQKEKKRYVVYGAKKEKK
jgi:hypothetical protein